MAITRTRVADDTWVFTSELYAEVNAGLVVTTEGCILIDTLPFPSETRQIIEFADRICPDGIRYVINTISHADHVYGSYLFPDAELMAHRSVARCWRGSAAKPSTMLANTRPNCSR
ncbi:MAG: MBL fold metallo-hydrolase [Caldilineaceae bacterium]